jgi:hypothetical protein
VGRIAAVHGVTCYTCPSSLTLGELMKRRRFITLTRADIFGQALANEGREGESARNIHDRFTADFALC